MYSTEETVDHIKECSSFILDKIKKMKDNETNWTVNELYMFTDIVKDVSEIHKNICKIHKYKTYSQEILN